MKGFTFFTNKQWFRTISQSFSTVLMIVLFCFFVVPLIFPHIVSAEVDITKPSPTSPPTSTAIADAATAAAKVAVSPVGALIPGVGNAMFATLISILNASLAIIQPLVAALLFFAGMLLDFIITLSTTKLGESLKNLTGINIAWRLIRDLCNMSFIFILVYTGIMTIFTGDNKAKKIIVPVIIAAILINFSLFFTKLIIDASNVVTISFYNSIMTGASTAGSFSVTDSGTVSSGISSAFMKSLNLTSVYSKDIFSTDPTKAGIGTITIIGSIIFMLVAVFVFLAMAVLFFLRYLLFIFLLIISPLGYMSAVLPGSGIADVSKKYWGTLLGQAYFAPLFMIMVWIDLTVVQGLNLGIGNLGKALAQPNDPSAMGSILNFFIVIGFLILTIIVSKDQATKGGYASSKLVALGTGFLGSALFGGTAAVGRRTLGRIGESVANNQTLKDKAAAGGKLAQLTLAGGRKTAGATFDGRRSFLGEQAGSLTGVDLGKGSIFNAKAGEGGYEKIVKDKKDAEKKYAASLEATDEAKKAAQDQLKIENENTKNLATQKAKIDAEVATKHGAERAAVETTKTTAEQEKKVAEQAAKTKENEIKDIDKEISRLEEVVKNNPSNAQAARDLTTQKTIKTTKDTEFKTLTDKVAEKKTAFENAEKVITAIATKENETRLKFIETSKDKEIMKLRDLAYTAGGSKDNKDAEALMKNLGVDTSKDGGLHISSAKDANIDRYANALETKKTWARIWFTTPEINKRAAMVVRASKKSKSANEKAADILKELGAAGAIPGVTPTPATPAAPTPAPKTP